MKFVVYELELWKYFGSIYTMIIDQIFASLNRLLYE